MYDTVIIGTGIAGSQVGYTLAKRGRKYLLCTDKFNPMNNTSALSYGHFRIPIGLDIDKTIDFSVDNLGEDREKMFFIYHQAYKVLEILSELHIPFKAKSFGVIIDSDKRGGFVLLKKLQSYIKNNISCNTKLIDFVERDNYVEVFLQTLSGIEKVVAKRLVIATGGYGGSYNYTDNIQYDNLSVFDLLVSAPPN